MHNVSICLQDSTHLLIVNRWRAILYGTDSLCIRLYLRLPKCVLLAMHTRIRFVLTFLQISWYLLTSYSVSTNLTTSTKTSSTSTNKPGTTSTTSTTTAPVSTATTISSFAKAAGTVFQINEKKTYFAGTNCYWCGFLNKNADIDLVMSHLAAVSSLLIFQWCYLTSHSPDSRFFGFGALTMSPQPKVLVQSGINLSYRANHQ